MTLNDLFVEYENNRIDLKKRLILCDYASQEGYEINNKEQFQKFLNSKNEFFVLNHQESNNFLIYDYFTMRKVKPYLVALKHPMMTNAYWKDVPDEILDVFIKDGIYRYIKVEYNNAIVDYIIEYPVDIEEKLFDKSKKLFPKLFDKNYSNYNNISLVFTNGNRFTELDSSNFLIYDLNEIYPESKTKFTPLTLSRKIWADLKTVTK